MANKKKAPQSPITATQRRLINSASELGYNAAGAFESVVAVLSKLTVDDEAAIAAFAKAYKLGFGVRYMELHDRSYAKRTGNQPLAEKLEAIDDIFALKYRDSKLKADSPTPKGMRDHRQQRMCKGADQSWMRAKEAAGLKVKKSRKPRQKAAPPAEVPTDLSKLTPTFANKKAANDWFGNMAAALLVTCDENNSKSGGKFVTPQLTSAVSDFLKAVKAAIGKA